MIFGTFWFGNQYFEKVTPESETSDRDLSFGSDQASRGLQICDEKWDGVWKTTFPTAGEVFRVGNRDFNIFLYQIVDIGLNFNLEGSKIQKKRFLDQKILKIVEKSRKFQANYNYPSFIEADFHLAAA